ncbi:MAG: glycoside hydrolase family 125 protein [Muribaculaceae bacterium]|nr:glycoside hydrolase family 125 protein [Muribaculaceae bacterium]
MKINHLAITTALVALGLCSTKIYALPTPVCEADNTRATSEKYMVTNRPPVNERLFKSDEVERQILRVKSLLTNPKLSWMFENCFPNTLDTTVHFRLDDEGKNDTFVYTGDIHAMWLRDSGAQVWPYVQLSNADDALKNMVEGVIRRQLQCILLDPYANAFNDGPTGGEWMSDNTAMIPDVHERKWEIDSLCYPIRLAYEYWKVTGDTSIFDETWLAAVNKIYDTFVEQQKKDGHGSYTFTRKTDRAFDTLSNNGMGTPVKPCGLIASAFRPSDDATTLQFLVPSNFFAVSSLRKAAEILQTVNNEPALAQKCETLAEEVSKALSEYALYQHSEFGTIYAFEVDGFGNHLLMDDANVPSLLAMAYLGDVDVNDLIYQNTRRFVWSEYNPYFFRGTAGEGIGGPHVGYRMAWPMSIMMKAFTSTDDNEIKECLTMLLNTDDEKGFIHESFNVDNPADYTRDWFAWQNTLFGELILKLVNEGKIDLLNSL